MDKEYIDVAKNIKEELFNDISNIYNKYNNELILQLSDINLLDDLNSSVSSSTAIGYCVEEFLIKKLMLLNPKKYMRVQDSKTVNTSADLIIFHSKYKIMVNFKANKNTSTNNAIAALGCIYNDYVKTNPEQKKLYLIFITYYRILRGKVKIDNLKLYYLGQIFFQHLKIDSRNWSKDFKSNSGRLQYNLKKYNRKDINKIDYDSTCNSLENYLLKLNKTIKN